MTYHWLLLLLLYDDVLSFGNINYMAHDDVYHRGKLKSASFYRVFPARSLLLNNAITKGGN